MLLSAIQGSRSGSCLVVIDQVLGHFWGPGPPPLLLLHTNGILLHAPNCSDLQRLLDWNGAIGTFSDGGGLAGMPRLSRNTAKDSNYC